MENLCSPLLLHHCLSSLEVELVSSKLVGGSHLGGFFWRENEESVLAPQPRTMVP